jgi:phosphohistidine phosphatase
MIPSAVDATVLVAIQRALDDTSGRGLRCTGCGMKTLFLIRHGKSSWDETTLPDEDRPLNDRGKRDAPKMGERLAKRDVKPDLILSSPVMRALMTAEIIAKKLGYKLKDIVVDDRLYAVEADDLLHVIHKQQQAGARDAVWPQPRVDRTRASLSSEITHLPTCAVAEFKFDAKSWSNIGKVKPAKVTLDYPKKS